MIALAKATTKATATNANNDYADMKRNPSSSPCSHRCRSHPLSPPLLALFSSPPFPSPRLSPICLPLHCLIPLLQLESLLVVVIVVVAAVVCVIVIDVVIASVEFDVVVKVGAAGAVAVAAMKTIRIAPN